MMKYFADLLVAANKAGIVTEAMMYESGFITIDGKTEDGKHFHITMSCKEEENDGN